LAHNRLLLGGKPLEGKGKHLRKVKQIIEKIF